MDDYALVLNAGSSSLKFCVFDGRRARAGIWQRAVRSKASARRLVCPSKDANGESHCEPGRCRSRCDMKHSMRSPVGCARNTVVRACWVWAIAWSMAARSSRVQRY